MEYICEICNNKFINKNIYNQHKNRKTNCLTKEKKIIKEKKIYQCNKCDKIFNQKSNYEYHINRKIQCKDINNLNIDDNNLMILEKKDIILMFNNLKKKIIEMNSSMNINNNNSNNNIINNITNNNTINYVNHGKEDLSLLVKDEIKDILNSGYNCIYKSVVLTHFNDRLPQFRNIRYTDPKSSYCEVYENGEWKMAKFEITIEELITKHFDEVYDMFNDNKDLIESPYKQKLIDEYLDDYNKYISFIDLDKYPDNWNDTMKKEKQKQTRKRLNRNKDEIKTLIINKSLFDKKQSIKNQPATIQYCESLGSVNDDILKLE